ncbi:MAG: hypothetical protein GX417_07050 [Clostridiales bacterium]|nr:hypothetical protein [Clostridiales bacterium]
MVIQESPETHNFRERLSIAGPKDRINRQDKAGTEHDYVGIRHPIRGIGRRVHPSPQSNAIPLLMGFCVVSEKELTLKQIRLIGIAYLLVALVLWLIAAFFIR